MSAPGPAPRGWLLASTARHLPGINGSAILTTSHLALMSNLAIWEWHGPASPPTPDALADARALRDTLDRIPIDGATTRDEYAARLHLAAKGVVL